MPWPTTSPIAIMSRPDGSGTASYQSPPMRMPSEPGRYRAASSTPTNRSSVVGSSDRWSASAVADCCSYRSAFSTAGATRRAISSASAQVLVFVGAFRCHAARTRSRRSARRRPAAGRSRASATSAHRRSRTVAYVGVAEPARPPRAVTLRDRASAPRCASPRPGRRVAARAVVGSATTSSVADPVPHRRDVGRRVRREPQTVAVGGQVDRAVVGERRAAPRARSRRAAPGCRGRPSAARSPTASRSRRDCARSASRPRYACSISSAKRLPSAVASSTSSGRYRRPDASV